RMSSLSECLPFAVHFEEEQRKVEAAVDQLQAAFFQAPREAGANEAERTRQLVEELSQLLRRLREHHADQTSGCVEEAVSRTRRLASTASALEREHGQLRQYLEQIIHAVRKYGFTRQTAASIEHDFNEFAENLCDHQAAVHRLIERGFN